jgi:hypothetical protein
VYPSATTSMQACGDTGERQKWLRAAHFPGLGGDAINGSLNCTEEYLLSSLQHARTSVSQHEPSGILGHCYTILISYLSMVYAMLAGRCSDCAPVCADCAPAISKSR